MYPFHQFMEPHHQPCSHPRDHNPHSYHYYPTWEQMHPHVKIEPPKPPTNYAPWPNNGVIHSNLPETNACCNYNYPHGYYSFRPSCSHFHPSPASHLCYHGPYTPYPEPYPAYLVNESHCCGCPNHQCHNRENTSSVKIEEQSPDAERKNSVSSSLVQLPNYPYPVVLVPDSKRDGWIPLGINGIKNLMQGVDHDKKTRLPWPLVWMRGNEKPEEAVKDLKEVSSTTPRNLEEPAKFKVVPLKLLENESCVDDSGKRVEQKVASEKENKTKNIPVKQVEESSQKKLVLYEKEKEKVDEKKSGVVEKPKEGNGAKKPSSPTKASKLPPVCLRVDPLPRRKSTNGNSRSPSPPEVRDKDSKRQMPKKDITVVEVKDKSSKTVDENCPIPKKEALETAASEIEDVVDSAKEEERKGAEGSEKNANEEKKFEERKVMRKLAESDAAVIIQAAYRGYEVRRWQPLEKLRKIARVREQTGDIRNQIHHLELSEKLDPKQRVIISESIMNLLLQLDTIQSLHPSVREIRKSVARDLVCLQEKLDALWNQIAQDNGPNKVEEKSSCKAPDDKAPSEVSEPVCSQELLPEINEKAEEGHQVDQIDKDWEMESGDNGTSNSDLKEPLEPVKDVAVSSDSEQQEGTPHSKHEWQSSGSEELQLINVKASEPRNGNAHLAPEEPLQLVSENESTVVELQEPVAAEHEPVNGENRRYEDEPLASSSDEMIIHGDATVVKSEAPGVSCEDIGYLQPIVVDGELEEEKPKQQLILERSINEANGTSVMPHSEHDVVETAAMEGDSSNMIVEETTRSQSISEPNESREVYEEIKENHCKQSDSTEKPDTAQSATEQLKEAASLATGTTDVTMRKGASENALQEEEVAVIEDETPVAKEGPAVQLEGSTPETKQLSGPGMNYNDEKKLWEENEKLRQMLEQLLEAGKEHLGAISSLNGRVKDLERKLLQKKKVED